MDQGLRREIASGARDGMAAAFDKSRKGTNGAGRGLAMSRPRLNQWPHRSRWFRWIFPAAARRTGADARQVARSWRKIRSGNEAKLEQMRPDRRREVATTLEQRLGASFKQVNDSLEQV